MLSTVGSVIVRIFTWIYELLKLLFGHIAIAISTWLSTITLPALPTILKIFSNATVNLALFFVVLLYILGMNISAFIMFGIDKKRAANKKRSRSRKEWRIPEKKLMCMAFFGGAGGALIGMQIFRHKTQHKSFVIMIPVLCVIQLVIDSVLLGFLGFWAFF